MAAPKSSGKFDTTGAVITGIQFAGDVASQIFNFQAVQAETERANAIAQIDYWTKWQVQNEENYRNYELQLNQWYRQSDYVERMRQYESKLAEQRSVYKGEVSTSATNNFAKYGVICHCCSNCRYRSLSNDAGLAPVKTALIKILRAVCSPPINSTISTRYPSNFKI